ncbi:MAG: hypothetical protein ChlgKO_10550 [Chlamydiales bacterium]
MFKNISTILPSTLDFALANPAVLSIDENSVFQVIAKCPTTHAAKKKPNKGSMFHRIACEKMIIEHIGTNVIKIERMILSAPSLTLSTFFVTSPDENGG